MATDSGGKLEGLRKLWHDTHGTGVKLGASDKSRMVEAGIRELGLEMEVFYRGGHFFRLDGTRVEMVKTVKAHKTGFETIKEQCTEI